MDQVLVNVSADAEQCASPWLWHVCREYELRVVVRKATVDADFGYVQLELSGSAEEIQRATAWLMTTGMHVEALTRALGA